MKRLVLIIAVLIVAASLSGCGKRQESLEEMQQPVSAETLNTMPSSMPAVQEVRTAVSVPAPEAQAGLEPLPSSSVSKPTAVEIQTALKNAGFYTGEIDGKLGPKSKVAIMEFQKANNLKADGKVGPKTWEVLSKSLVAATEPVKKKR